MKSKSMLMIAAVALLHFGVAQAVHAQYGAVSIENPTRQTIYYQFKWGQNAEWVSRSVPPGYTRTQYHELDANGQAPRPYIRFSDGAGEYREFWLGFYEVCNCSQNGKRYNFRWSACGCYLNLYAR